jgi:hypothetical protein
MTTKWLQERPHGSKNDYGMPPRRASRGLRPRCCRVNMAHTRQSRPISGLGFLVKGLKTFCNRSRFARQRSLPDKDGGHSGRPAKTVVGSDLRDAARCRMTGVTLHSNSDRCRRGAHPRRTALLLPAASSPLSSRVMRPPLGNRRRRRSLSRTPA